MKSPLVDGGTWHQLEETQSTQDWAAVDLMAGGGGVYFARSQTSGRGRFGREWLSHPGDSLTMSMTFAAYADHPAPHLIGMTAAVACAAVLRCELKWPNDVIAGAKKVGGILTELCPDNRGRRVPVVGVGLNLNQKQFPTDIAPFATSAAMYNGGHYEPVEIAQALLDRLATLPEPTSWPELAPVWNLFDHTPGKNYKLPSGDVAIALGIGPEGQLLGSVDGETTVVYAADALFG